MPVADLPIEVDTRSGLFGVLSHSEASGSIGAVILSAGLLHRVGPFRMNVELGRALAHAGVPTLRLDQSGKGDSPARAGISREASVTEDIDAAVAVLREHTGVDRVALIGLCSGADDIINYCPTNGDVRAIVLLDGFAHPNVAYYLHTLKAKLVSGLTKLSRLGKRSGLRQLNPRRTVATYYEEDAVDIREWSSADEMLHRFSKLDAAGVANLSIFTSGVAEYYAYQGQLSQNLTSSGYTLKHLNEVYFPDAKHLYPLTSHRQRLVTTVSDWLKGLSNG